MNSGRAEFVTLVMTVMLVSIIAMAYLLRPVVAYAGIGVLAILGVVQFVEGLLRFLKAPTSKPTGRRTSNGKTGGQ